MEIDDRITLFRDMVACCHNLYLWVYDSSFYLISSNCPEHNAIDGLFVMSCRKGEFEQQLWEQDTPIILSNEIGLMWIMVPLWQDGKLIRTYVLGPFFVDDTPQKSFAKYLDEHKLSLQLRKDFLKFLEVLPIISLNRIFEYAIMFYFCITNQKISVSDLRYHKSSTGKVSDSGQWEAAEAHGTYRREQELLQMVREGNLNYKRQASRLSVTGNLGKLSNGDPLRQMKNAVLAGITLFCRAAIEGGLTPEMSYTLADTYFQSAEACTNITDLVDISHTMQEDYIQRVHRCRTAALSQPIQACCEYIEMHLEDKLSLPILAQQTGYTEDYLTRKFKREMSVTPVVYIRNQRLERSALLLRTTRDDIQEISEQLQFCSQSYFADNFRKRFGVSPTEYRQKKNPDFSPD